jgi:hypothetical protein
MKYFKIFHIAFAVLLVSAFVFLPLDNSVQAKGKSNKHEHNATRLYLDVPASLSVGQPGTIVIQLYTVGGYPVANQTVELLANGARVRRARTNFAGTASVDFTPQQAGPASITAVYNGSHKESMLPAIASAKIDIIPAVVTIQTVPPTPGINFSMAGQIFTSNKDGVALIQVSQTGSYRLVALPWAGGNPNMSVQFSRWGDEVFSSDREVNVPLDQILQAGFSVSYAVSHTFVDLDNHPVDASLISGYTLKGSDGKTYSFTDNAPHILPSGRIIRLGNGLEETKILYSIMTVNMNGSNVVSQAQQRFFVRPNDEWPIQLLLYSARFSARDALFPFPVGSGISLIFPDGRTQAFTFGARGEPINALLPRGLYYATVTNVHGMAPSTPIALSRSQDVSLLVVSDFDIIVVFLVGIGVALLLLYMGRPRVFLDLAALRYRFMRARSSGD